MSSLARLPSGIVVGGRIVPLMQPGAREVYYDNFGLLNGSVWQPLVGTFDVSGNRLRALTAGTFPPYNLVQNGESWVGGPPPTGWFQARGVATTVNSTVEPGVTSPGTDSTVLKVVSSAALNGVAGRSVDISVVLGATYKSSCYCYVPNTNSTVYAGRLSPTIGIKNITIEDTWQLLTVTAEALAVTTGMNLYNQDGGSGDVAYFDSASLYCQSSVLAYLPSLVNGTITYSMVMPASGVVPQSYIFRRTSLLDYWELRVLPNTGTSDTEIWEYVNGVGTRRANSLTGWTAGGTDYISIGLNGATISISAMKQGASVWSPCCSWNSALTGISSGQTGPMFYGVTGASANWLGDFTAVAR